MISSVFSGQKSRLKLRAYGSAPWTESEPGVTFKTSKSEIVRDEIKTVSSVFKVYKNILHHQRKVFKHPEDTDKPCFPNILTF